MKSNPVALVILDGFGYSLHNTYNAIAHAQKPTFDYLFKNYPHTLLAASGSAVGLPEGFEGNSEVGHSTIGAGRIIPSLFSCIHTDINSGAFFTNATLTSNLNLLAHNGKTLHIIGLLSDAGNQSHQEVIFALIKAAVDHHVKKIIVHAILDGRDVPPQSAAVYLQALQNYCSHYSRVSIGSITGRYYAMDRNNNWDRTQLTYDMLTQKTEPRFASWQEALSFYYAKNNTDEFIPPTILQTTPLACHDGIIFANFREDRARQLTACFVVPELTPLVLQPLFLSFFISMVRYDSRFKNPVLYTISPVSLTLKEVLSNAGKTLFSIAETEKYAHVTYFFAHGKEEAFTRETRVLIPSGNGAQTPQMSAQEITDAISNSLKKDPADFYVINYANADMLGHTGNFDATVKAVECLDDQIKQLYHLVVKTMNGILCITADHGNAEVMFDEKTGQPHTGHTRNKVPFLWIKNDLYQKKIHLPLQGLADIAPFILKEFGIPVPPEMENR